MRSVHRRNRRLTGLATHVARVDAPHTFESFLYQMKQEYVSARWLLYQGLTVKTPDFSDRDVFVSATEPLPSLLGNRKGQSRLQDFHSLRKIGFFVNAYMELGIPERTGSETLWAHGRKHTNSKRIRLTGNWGFCAVPARQGLLRGGGGDELAEPQARGLSDIRNHIDKYLRVTVASPRPCHLTTSLHGASRGQFEGNAMHLLNGQVSEGA